MGKEDQIADAILELGRMVQFLGLGNATGGGHGHGAIELCSINLNDRMRDLTDALNNISTSISDVAEAIENLNELDDKKQ